MLAVKEMTKIISPSQIRGIDYGRSGIHLFENTDDGAGF